MSIDPESQKILTEAAVNTIGKHGSDIIRWFKKQGFKFFPANFNILICLETKEGINTGSYFQELKSNLLTAIDKAGLSSFIKVKDVSDLHKFNNKEEAESFRKRKDIDLIIWGELSSDRLKQNGKSVSEVRLNFTYGHPDDESKKLGEAIRFDINGRFALRNYWKIMEDSSFNDIKIVSSNIFDISLYILALTLKIYGQIEKSLTLFESLYKKYKETSDVFKESLKPHLYECYDLLIQNSLWNRRGNQKAEDYSKRLLLINNTHYSALTGLALAQYRLGKILESEATVQEIQLLYPNSAATLVDVAFFQILKGRYGKAYETYKKLIRIYKKQAPGFNAQQVLEFLYEEYERTKEPALLYATGIISWYFGDPELARKDLEIFAGLQLIGKYKYMQNHAKRLLGE